MGKILTTEEIQNLALEIARNKQFIERIDDYEKQKIKELIDFELGTYSYQVKVEKNIPQERIDKIESYKLAKKWLQMDEMLTSLKGIIDSDPVDTTIDKLSHPQKALLLYYNGEDLQKDAPMRLKHTFTSLSKPGAAGDRERRCSGSAKRTLTQRLIDFEMIAPLINSTNGLQKLQDDKTAIEKEYENK